MPKHMGNGHKSTAFHDHPVQHLRLLLTSNVVCQQKRLESIPQGRNATELVISSLLLCDKAHLLGIGDQLQAAAKIKSRPESA